MRACAVVPVLLFHAGFEYFSGGFVGVDVFFVISGYLITTLLLKDFSENSFSLANFYERRARRILPALFFVVFCTIPFSLYLMLPHQALDFANSVLATLLFASNILFWTESSYFAEYSELKPLLHTWSLAVEEQYYIFFPLFLMACYKLGRKILLSVLAVVFLLSFALAQWASVSHPYANFYLLPFRGWEILLGVFCAFEGGKLAKSTGNVLRDILSIIGIFAIIAPVFVYDATTPFPSVYALLPTLGATLIILCSDDDTLVGRILSSRILVGIGLISYSLYLWHQPLFALARLASTNQPTTALYLALIAASLLLAVFSWKYVEQPFRQRSVLTSAQVAMSAGAGASLLCVIAAVVLLSGGLPQRFDYPSEQLLQSNNTFRSYLRGTSESLILRPFDEADPRQKMLVIGDSFSQDFFNIVSESSIADDYQLSSHRISADCGNLFLNDYSTIRGHIDQRCNTAGSVLLRNGYYSDPRLLDLMVQADVLILASDWREWQIPYLSESLEKLSSLSPAAIIVLATKSFPEAEQRRRFLDMSPEQRIAFTVAQDQAYSMINSDLGARVSELANAAVNPPTWFDFADYYCHRLQCRLFNDAGDLLSYDGKHLTQAGAKFFAQYVEKLLLE